MGTSGSGSHFSMSLLISLSNWISRFNLLLHSPNNLYSHLLSLKIITQYPVKLTRQPDVSCNLRTRTFPLFSRNSFNQCLNCLLTTFRIYIHLSSECLQFPEANLLENCAGTITKSSVSQDEFLLLLPAESFDPCRKPGESWVGDANAFSCSCCCISPRDC